MPPFSRLRTCVLASAFLLTAAGALTAAPQQHAPDAHMSVSLYQGKALSFNEQIGAVFVAQPSIASYQVVGNRKVVVFGSYPGKTSLMVLGTDGRTLYNGLVEVAYDVSSMEMALKSSFPKLKLQLVALNDGVAVRGKVETAQEAANVVAFLDAMLQVNPQQAQMAAADVSAAGQEGQQEKSGAATGTGTLGARIGKIINQLTVTTPNQVTVRVRFAEVNRKLSDQLGFKWKGSYSGSRGGITFGSADNPIISNPNNSLGSLFDPATMAARFTFGSLFDAMASEELVSILAEPNLTVVSGETASFLAGGQIPFQSSDGDGGFDIEFKDYGVLLSITPTSLSGNRISLRLRPEVSERSDSNGIQFMGSTQPGFIVRRAESTIELASGQSFAIAGLLKNDFSNTVNKIPGIADLPIIGALARSKAFERGETELVIVATAYISTPSGEPYTIPNEEMYVPTIFERYFMDADPQVSSGTALKTARKPSFVSEKYRLDSAPVVKPQPSAAAPSGKTSPADLVSEFIY